MLPSKPKEQDYVSDLIKETSEIKKTIICKLTITAQELELCQMCSMTFHRRVLCR